MASAASKDFGPIRHDYDFFLAHTTEAAEDLRAYLPHLRPLAAGTGQVRMLDFGCGNGGFSAQFLASAGFAPERLHLSLVEPVEVYRQQAAERLRPLTAHPLRVWPALPPEAAACFDLVLSNHVLYYVPDVDATLAAILKALAAPGLFLTALSGRPSALTGLWQQCFDLIGKPAPFHLSEELEAALVRRGQRYDKEEVPFELAFPDSEANRLSILRFLLGSYFDEVPRPAMLRMFDPYVEGGRVVMRLVDEHFIVRREA